MAVAVAGLAAGVRSGMQAGAPAAFPTLPNVTAGEGDTISIAVAETGQPAGITYTATGLPAGLHIDNENFTDGTGSHSRGVIRGTLRRGAAGTDPASSGGSYTGDEGVYSIQIRASDNTTSNTFSFDVGRWGAGDVFVGGGTYTYQVYTKDADFKYDVVVGDRLTTTGFTTGCAANWHTGEVWATNFENSVDVITRHATNPLAPYTDATRRVSTLRYFAGGLNPVDANVESIAFDNAQNMFVGHSFGWANNNGDPSDANGKAVWLDDTWTLTARFITATSYYYDWNRYKTTVNPGSGPQWDDYGSIITDVNGLPILVQYPILTSVMRNEAISAWGTTGDWNDHKGDAAGLVTVDATGTPLLAAGGQYVPFDQAVSPDGFYETWVNDVAQYIRTAGGAKIALREQAGMDIHKYPLGTLGYGRNNLLTYPTVYSNVRYGFTGADAIDLLSDQTTAIYSSENQYLYRHNLASNTQLPVVGSTTLSSGTANNDISHPIANVPIYGVRVLPPGDGTGGYLVGTEARILRLDRNGNTIQTYDAVNDPDYPDNDATGWFALAMAPDGRSFWAATRQDVYHFDIASGSVLGDKIHATDPGDGHVGAELAGLCVINEYRAARENCGVNGTGNGIDDDGDGIIDNGCFRLEICSVDSPGDDDGNGLVDYNDPACYPAGQQPANTMCAASGPTDSSVAGFCARQNAEGEQVSVQAVPLPCAGAACSAWTFNYVATGLPTGLTMNPSTGEVSGTPAYSIVANLITAPPAVFPVAVTGTWTQTGHAPTTVTSTFNWTIVNTNRPPVAADDTARAQSGGSVLIDVLANDTDLDSTDVKSIVVGSITTPLNASSQATGTATIVSGKIQYNAPAGVFGPVTFFYQTQDNYGVPGVSNQAKVTVTINGTPVARDDSYQMLGGTSLTVNAANGIIRNAAGSDSDPEGATLTVSTNTAPSHGSLSLNADGSFTYTPVPGFTGTDTFTYRVTDGEAVSNLATVTIVVPTPPVANNDSYSTQVNTTLTLVNAWDSILFNDTDPLNRTLSISSSTNPSHGSISLNTTTGLFTYVPVTGYTGTDTFTYVVTNGAYTSNTATVTITIRTANNPPVAVNDSFNMNAGTTLTVASGTILLNDSDPDRDTFSASLVSSTSTGTLNFTATTGAFTFTPAPGFSGPVTFTYKVTDILGLASNVATVTINVNAIPVAVNDAYTTPEDTTLTIAARGILANDTDADAGSVLSVVLPIITQPTHGTITQNANGSFVYVPTLNYFGTDTYTYRVVDEKGAVSVNPATVTITITPVNDKPVASADAYSTQEGTALVVSNPVLGFIQRNDTDVDDAVTVLRATMVSTVSHGSLVFGTDGTFTYTPTIGFSGTDTFTYFVKDAAGASSNTVTVTITVIPTDLAATASAVCQGNAAYVNYSLAPVNYTLPVGSTAKIEWVDSSNRIVRTDNAQALSGQTVWPGTIVLLGLAVDWPGWILSGVLWSEGADGFELTKPAVTVRFTVGSKIKEVSVAYPGAITGCLPQPPINLPPTASNDSYTTNLNSPLTIAAPGIIGNDRDPESGALTPVLNTQPANGTLTQNADGSFTYVPNNNFVGTDTYSYKVRDVGGLLSNLANVTILVTGPTTAEVPNVTSVYDATTHGTTCTIRGGDGTTFPGSISYSPALTSHVGTYTATCAFAGDARYLPASATGTITITPKPVTITANSRSKVYGSASTFVGTEFTTTALAAGDSITSVSLASTGSPATAVVAGSNYAIVPSAAVGTNLSDYTVTYVNGALTVTKAPLTITANSTSKAFGVALSFAGTEFTKTGLVNTDTVTSATLTSAGASASASAGSYTIVPSAAVGTGLDNYTVTYVNGTLTVTGGNCVDPSTLAGALVQRNAYFNGRTEGNVQVMTAVDINFNSGTVLTGDLRIIGTPQMTINGSPTYGGTVDGTGASTPTSHRIIINSGATVGRVVRRTAAVALPTVNAPTASTGTRSVVMNSSSDATGSFTTIKDLTLNSNVGPVAVPAGNYNTFTANTNTSFVLGTVGATTPSVYNFQSLNMNSGSSLSIVGPVVVNLKNSVSFNGNVGASAHPEWLTFNVSNGGVTLNAGAFTFYGYINAPTGGFTVNSGTKLVGGFAADTYTSNSGGTVVLQPISACAPNRAPVAVDDSYSTMKNTALTIAAPGVLTNDSDPDGNPVTAEIVTNSANGTVALNANGGFTFTPATDFTGTTTFTYKAKDSAGLYSNVATATIVVLGTTVAVPDATFTYDNATHATTCTVAGTDGTSLTGTLTYSPALSKNVGTYTATCAFAGDSRFPAATGTGTVRINPAPLTITANSRTKAYGAVVTFAGTEITKTGLIGSDTVTSATLSSTGAVATAVAGTYAIVPAAAVGTGLSNYTISYVNGTLTVTALATTVTVPNATYAYDGATHGTTCSVTSTDSASLTGTLSYGLGAGVLPKAAGTYTATCTFTTDGKHASATGTGTVTITPKAAVVTAGGGTKVYGASDPALSTTTSTGFLSGDLTGIALASTRAGGENVGSYQTTATAAGGNVGNYNVTYNPGNFTITKATPVTAAAGGSFNYDGQAHGGTCTVTGVGGAQLTGTISYSGGSVPVAVGTYSVTCAFAGNTNYNAATSSTATITIINPNRAPVAVNDTFTATKNTRLNVPAAGVKVNDSDPDGDTFTSEIVTNPTKGTITLNSDGSFSYMPSNNYVGVDTFTYKVKDSKGVYSNVATVTINITAVACVLQAVDDAYTTNTNHAITIVAGGVMGNDQDPYNRGLVISKVAGSTSKVGVSTATAHGTVKLNADGSFTYTPASNYSGTDTFTYEMKSSYNNTTDSATVTISVNGHYDNDGCDHDRHTDGHRDGDRCDHDKALARHYSGDYCDHDRSRNGHHNGDGCGHDRDTHRHYAGDNCDHERRRNGHSSSDDCSHNQNVSSHSDGDYCDHDRKRNGHRDGDGCTHDKAARHHNDGDDCDHEAGRNGHSESDKCDHDRDDHSHNAGDGCDHDRGRNGHYDGDRCEHDEHQGDDDSDDNACIVTTGNGGGTHHSGGHDDQHHTGDYCDHERRRNGHSSGDNCEHSRVSSHSNDDYCDHDRGRNGHRDGDQCDHDKSQRSSRDWSWGWRDRD